MASINNSALVIMHDAEYFAGSHKIDSCCKI